MGTIILAVVAVGLLVLFEIAKTPREEAPPKRVALEVLVLSLIVFGAIAAWSWFTR